MPSATPRRLANPWKAFLVDIDRPLPRSIDIHCLGGFVAALYYDLPRPTNDLDYIAVIPRDALATLQHLAGVESPLAKKHRVHIQHVGVASLPESYAERLAEIAPGMCERLRIFALDAHDLALSKLARNNPIDRHDVAQLAKAVPLDPNLLRRRYREELRPIIIGDIERSDRTLEMWIEAYFGS
jgi:Nucleotidyltransferase of unknown function (DUF6036)